MEKYCFFRSTICVLGRTKKVIDFIKKYELHLNFGGYFDHILENFYLDMWSKGNIDIPYEKEIVETIFLKDFVNNWNRYKKQWSDLEAVSYDDLTKEEKNYINSKILNEETVEKKPKTNKKTKQVGNGEGSLYFSDTQKCWIFQYYDTNGKRQTMKQKKKESTKDFKVRVTEIKNSLNTGTYISKSNDTIKSILENYVKQKNLDGITSDRSYNREKETLAQISYCCNNFYDKPIQKVSVSDIEKSKENMRKYSKSTISKIWALLYKAFKIAYSRRIIQYNTMEDETLIPPISHKPNKKVEALTVEEEKKLEKSLLSNKTVYNTILLLQLYTGMRIGEVLALSKDCINFKDNTLTVYRTITRDKNDKVILGKHTKTYNKKTGIDKGKRIFPLSSKVKKLLEEQLNNKITNIYNLIFWDYKKNTFITDGEINSYLNRLNVKENITRHIHTHMLRHTFITRCQEKGIPLVVLQSLVGHVEGSSITNDVYTSVSIDFMKQELEKIN